MMDGRSIISEPDRSVAMMKVASLISTHGVIFGHHTWG
jgi:hypothetical protein